MIETRMKQSSISALSRELEVLCEIVSFPNLSSASLQVGISQPQLSRIIAKIERALSVKLLDRDVRRKASWTALATELAQTYRRHQRHLQAEVAGLIEHSPTRHLRFGALEGLLALASDLGHRALRVTGMKTLELDILDLSELEDRFLRGDLDLILTMREPGRRKFRYSRVLGHQLLEEVRKPAREVETRIHSAYEFRAKQARDSTEAGPLPQKTLISNSLALRRYWVENYGGKGFFPSQPSERKASQSGGTPVLLVGSELLAPELWKAIL
ncbi:MAG: hypothetical protein RJB38_761 [Pseudomonadota bacterium]|jgi:DNA-binding transcriptional LysR family regulator